MTAEANDSAWYSIVLKKNVQTLDDIEGQAFVDVVFDSATRVLHRQHTSRDSARTSSTGCTPRRPGKSTDLHRKAANSITMPRGASSAEDVVSMKGRTT